MLLTYFKLNFKIIHQLLPIKHILYAFWNTGVIFFFSYLELWNTCQIYAQYIENIHIMIMHPPQNTARLNWIIRQASLVLAQFSRKTAKTNVKRFSFVHSIWCGKRTLTVNAIPYIVQNKKKCWKTGFWNKYSNKIGTHRTFKILNSV